MTFVLRIGFYPWEWISDALALGCRSENHEVGILQVVLLHVLDEVVPELTGMGMGQGVRSGDVAVTDRGHHFIMLVRQKHAFMPLFELGKMQMKHPAPLIEQSLVEGGQVGVPASGSYGHMKVLVGL